MTLIDIAVFNYFLIFVALGIATLSATIGRNPLKWLVAALILVLTESVLLFFS